MIYFGLKPIAKFLRSNNKRLGFAGGMGQIISQLFANNEQGFAFDFNDLSTMYQDAAGTIPVTGVGQPVGLILDKSKGVALGAEKIINGDFANGTTGWVSGTHWTATLGTSTDALIITTNSANGYGCAIQAVPLVAGKTYKITGKYRSSQGGKPAIGLGTSTGAVNKILVSSTTSVEFVEFSAIFTHTSGSLMLYNNTTANGVVSEFKNVSIKEVLGNYATQSTSAKRPILQQNAITGAYYLEFDGVDDHLVTSNVNLATANNLTIFAGIYKAVDSNARTVLEIGESVDRIDKTISINTYSDSNEKLTLVNHNKIVTIATCTDPLFNAPKSIVFTGVINNAEGYMFEQLNKTTKIQKTFTPTNNTYTNFAANIGNRTNGSRPWSGYIYNLVGISRVATPTEITNAENVIAKNVGVTL